MSNDAYFFISHCVEFHSDLLRNALPFLLTLCLRVSFQCGIPQVSGHRGYGRAAVFIVPGFVPRNGVPSPFYSNCRRRPAVTV